MSRKDDITKKKALFGNKRSHSMHATRRRWDLNIQSVKIWQDGKIVKVNVSARTLKKLKKHNKVVKIKYENAPLTK